MRKRVSRMFYEEAGKNLQQYRMYYHYLLWISEASINTLRKLREMISPLLE
jgi:hypothetical protein